MYCLKSCCTAKQRGCSFSGHLRRGDLPRSRLEKGRKGGKESQGGDLRLPISDCGLKIKNRQMKVVNQCHSKIENRQLEIRLYSPLPHFTHFVVSGRISRRPLSIGLPHDEHLP